MKGADKALLLAVVIGGICIVLVLAFLLKNDAPPALPVETAGETVTESGEPAPFPESVDPVPGGSAQERIQLEAQGSEKATSGSDQNAIFGRIMSEYGGPVSDAKIVANPKNSMKIGGDLKNLAEESVAFEPIEGSSDSEGRFRITGLPKAKHLRFHVSHPDHVPTLVSVKGYSGERHDMGDIVLDAGGSVSGYVVDENGRGLPEVEVSGRPVEKQGGSAFFSFSMLKQTTMDWKGSTEPDGFFRIAELPRGKVKLRAAHPDRPGVEVNDIAIDKGRETRNVKLVMPAGLTIAGWVVDEEDQPIEGASVLMEPDLDFGIEDLEHFDPGMFESFIPRETDEAGQFLLKGLSAGQYTLRIAAASYLSSREEKVKAGTSDLVVVLRKGGWLAGRVLDARTRKGIGEFSINVGQEGVRILKGDEAGAMREEALGTRGAYFIEGLGKEPFNLDISAEGYADEKIEALSSGPGQGEVLDLLLWEESTVSGRLVGPSGEPVVEGTITLQDQDPDNDEVESALDSVGIAFGAVKRWTDTKDTKSDEHGAFSLKGIREGAYRITASHAMHTDSEPMELTIARAEKVEGLEIRLGLAGSLSGLVLDMDGVPMPGARVMITRSSGLISIVASAVSGGDPNFDLLNERTDEEGKFLVNGLEAGTYRLQLAPDLDEESLGGILNSTLSGVMGNSGPGILEARVKEGAVTEVVLQETPKGGIAGTVLEAGIPVPGIKVKLYQSELGPLAILPLMTTGTDENGAYLFRKLEQGAYDLKLDLPGHADPLQESVTLTAGKIALQDFVLPSGRVSGTVTDAVTGDPLSGIKVWLKRIEKGKSGNKGLLESLFSGASASIKVDSDDLGGDVQALLKPAPVTTDDHGSYVIRFVEEGEYEIAASGVKYAEGTLGPLKISAGSEATGKDLKLTRGYEVSGTVMDDTLGTPVGFCPVTLEHNAKKRKARTNEKGLFSFKGLEPGTYHLGAKKKGLTSETDLSIEKEDVKNLVLNIR